MTMDGDERNPGLPLAFARRHGIVVAPGTRPGEAAAAVTIVAREDCPEQIWREARRLLGRPVTVSIRPDQTVLETLERVYGGRFETTDTATLDMGLEIEDGGAESLVTDLLDSSPEAPVIQLINTLLRQALQRRASDMHVEPMETGLRVRMRIDGDLRTVVERRDAPVGRVVSRLKVMARLDIAETRLPQDGRIALRFGGRSVDVRVSTLPSKDGERVVLRILDKSTGLISLEDLGLWAEQRRRIEHMVAHTNGIVLVTGPTGSGKTTTLYSLMRKLNDTRRNILTVEDPVEYDLPGIGQTQVNPQIGMTFAHSLRAILRQDPDIVLIGEIRDGETASIAVQAALTGHLVFSTLHTNTRRRRGNPPARSRNRALPAVVDYSGTRFSTPGTPGMSGMLRYRAVHCHGALVLREKWRTGTGVRAASLRLPGLRRDRLCRSSRHLRDRRRRFETCREDS